ncbi:MAG: pilus assembly protein [Elusimicrobiota bacterium]|jgi:hypothetical protein|nr:pilus assembly protein [Elusimicrobiota bacterium]
MELAFMKAKNSQNYKNLNLIKKQGGQALIEAVFFIPIILLFLVAIIWFSRVMLTYQQMHTAAKYGSDLIAYTPFSQKYIKSDIGDYLCNSNNIGRILDPNKLEVLVELNDYTPVDYNFSIPNISDFDPSKFASELGGFSFDESKTSYVEVKYSYEIPKLLQITGRQNITLKVRLELLSGCGNKGYSGRQK